MHDFSDELSQKNHLNLTAGDFVKITNKNHKKVDVHLTTNILAYYKTIISNSASHNINMNTEESNSIENPSPSLHRETKYHWKINKTAIEN